jgi:hypothetical protein
VNDAELLVEIDVAILAVPNGPEQLSCNAYRRGDLKELRAWREVAATVARAARGSALGYVVPVSQ